MFQLKLRFSFYLLYIEINFLILCFSISDGYSLFINIVLLAGTHRKRGYTVCSIRNIIFKSQIRTLKMRQIF